MSKLPKHILVVRLSAMGDVAMTIPVLRAFAEQYPDTKITVLTRKFFAPFFRDIPNLSVFHADVKGKHKGVIGLYRLSKELKALGIDAVADLHNVLRTNILKVFLRKKRFVQIDKGRQAKKDLITGKYFKQLKTTHQRYADVFNALGFTIGLSNPSFPESKKLSKAAQNTLGVKTKKWIGIAPFAQYEAKMYPITMLCQVIEKLSEDETICVLLFGGGDKEIDALQSIQKNYPGTINVAGKFSLDEELDIISNLDLIVSMDSGNGHIAAMLGKKVITIWGVTHPYAGFSPFNQEENLALVADRKLYPKIPTSVYGNKYPAGYENTTRSISPEMILEKIESLL